MNISRDVQMYSYKYIRIEEYETQKKENGQKTKIHYSTSLSLTAELNNIHAKIKKK